MPKEMVTDRDPRFTSAFMKEVMRMVGTKQSMSTAFHPQSDGQTERTNRILEDMLRHYVASDQKDWDQHLDAAEFAINNSYQESVKETPFMLNYGRHPNTPVSMLIEHNSKVPAAKSLVQQIADGIARAKECMKAAQDRYKAYADKSRVDCRFTVGQQVMLHTKNIRLQGAKKLLPRWLGPFTVERVVSPVAYKLTLPSTMQRVHFVFHVGLLKPYKLDPGRQSHGIVPVLEDADGPVFEVEAILGHRDQPLSVKQDGTPSKRTRREYLVRWRGYTPEHDSWEPTANVEPGCSELLADYWKTVSA
jgi:DNA polymerase IIIc chi subunit